MRDIRQVRIWTSRILALAVLTAALLAADNVFAADEAENQTPFMLVVMDPLAAPLACDCVQGYAQRKYEKLGEFLQPHVGRPVKVVFAHSLEKALTSDTGGRADLIVGKHSVVLSDAEKAQLKVTPVARLTGKDGKTTQTGLFVVLNGDPAQKIEDLSGYRILFGPADCDEKSAAPMRHLQNHEVALPDKIETCTSCADAAVKLLELGPDVRAAGVISSYAQPLLEGCGTVKKGDLRIVGETSEVPFITAFIDANMADAERTQVVNALNEIQYDIQMLIALESKQGFVPWTGDETDGTAEVAKKKD